MSLSKSIITFIEDLSFNVIIPTINRVFIVDNSWPHITKFKSEIFDNYMDTLSGQIFFTVHFDIFKKGTLNLTIIYNITHDIATQNTFTNIIINNIKGKSDYTTLFILDNIINVFNELSANIISIPDVTAIKFNGSKHIDLLMSLYTKQSVYANMGFIQLTYPLLLSEIQILLDTPINELRCSEDMLRDISNIFKVSVTGNLNTLFFIIYPKYVNKRYTTKELSLITKLYNFLISTYDSVKMYTTTSIYVKSTLPNPTLSMMNTSAPFTGNILKLLQKIPETDRLVYKYNPTHT